MRLYIFPVVPLLVALAFTASAQEISFVYDVEDTGAQFAPPVLPKFDELPSVKSLPDPFAWSSGQGRTTDFADWSRRRSEIKAEIEHYEIGEKPPRPQDISASFDGRKLTVKVTANDETLTLTAAVQLPEGKGPFPAVIGIGFGSGTGSLPPEIFASRKIATIAFNFSEVMAHTQKRGQEPINRLFPDLTSIGAYSAWSWGVSRIIDGLELVADQLPIDRKHLAVTGCSFAGKMALFAGAFDERIALTIAQEPGGGGAAAWRVSETLGKVETLGRTSHAWFIEDMFRFADSVDKLPYDHHELMAMVAPRALLILGNPDFEWLADESGYVSCRAAHEVWKTFGIPERFGFSIVAGHPHCRLPDSQRPEVEAFVDKFLLGKQDANTSITKHPFERVNYKKWYEDWQSSQPNLGSNRLLAAPGADAHAAWQRDDATSQEAHKQLVAKTLQGKIDVYFQGDSITRRWGATDYPVLLAHWKETFHGWNAANFAWGGDNTHHMLWRMRNGELDNIVPKVVCLQAGANNLPWTGPANESHVDDVVDGVQAIITEFRSRFPDVSIVLTAMFPRDQNAQLADTMDAINKELEAISNADDRIHWININRDLVGSDGKLLPGVSSDGIHLELAGYEAWANALQPVLKQLLGPPSEEDHAPPPTGIPGN